MKTKKMILWIVCLSVIASESTFAGIKYKWNDEKMLEATFVGGIGSAMFGSFVCGIDPIGCAGALGVMASVNLLVTTSNVLKYVPDEQLPLIREDASAFILDGEMTPLLQETIQNIRTQSGSELASVPDQDIALVISGL